MNCFWGQYIHMAVSEKADLVKQVNDLSVLKDDLTLEVSQ